MNEQLIEDLKTLRYVLKDDNDYEKWVIILDKIIQSLQPKEQLSADEVKRIANITAKEVWDKSYEIYGYHIHDKAEHRECFVMGYTNAMHDFANNSEGMKENAIGFAYYCASNILDKDKTFDEFYEAYLTNKEK